MSDARFKHIWLAPIQSEFEKMWRNCVPSIVNINNGANLESAVIAAVGTAGGTTLATAAAAGHTVVPVGNVVGFREGQAIGIGAGDDPETAVIAVLSYSRQLQSQDITAPESGKP
jgi:hypothetical protein